MKFDNLPSGITIQGVFDKSCTLDISEKSAVALKAGRLRLHVRSGSEKKTINNFQLQLSCIGGNIKILVGNDNSEVIFEDESSGVYDIRLWRKSKVVIGSRTTSNGIIIVCDDSEFQTGEDCMFSSGILIQSADQHGLVSLKSGEIFNNKYNQVVLGEHIWLGRNCTLMPDVNVGDGSIIGTGAVVTSDVPEKSIAVGVPAKVIKMDVTWSRSPTGLDKISKSYIESFKFN